MSEVLDNHNCDRCKKEHRVTPAIGFIPLPLLPDMAAQRRRIKVCQRHIAEAEEACYYVLRFGQDEASWDSSDFEKRVWAKHIRLRGSRRLKFFPRQRYAESEAAVKLAS